MDTLNNARTDDAKLSNALKSLYTTVFVAAQKRRRKAKPKRMQQLELQLTFD